MGTINTLSFSLFPLSPFPTPTPYSHISGYPQSMAFSKTTKSLAQQKRWENIRCRVYVGLAVAAGLLLILIVLLVIFLPSGGVSSNP